MTPAQIKLLKKVISFMRDADALEEELVEVGLINGVDPRTARSLVEVGVLVEAMPHNATEFTNTHVRFPSKWELQSQDQGE